jgi:hypothetical protein
MVVRLGTAASRGDIEAGRDGARKTCVSRGGHTLRLSGFPILGTCAQSRSLRGHLHRAPWSNRPPCLKRNGCHAAVVLRHRLPYKGIRPPIKSPFVKPTLANRPGAVGSGVVHGGGVAYCKTVRNSVNYTRLIQNTHGISLSIVDVYICAETCEARLAVDVPGRKSKCSFPKHWQRLNAARMTSSTSRWHA